MMMIEIDLFVPRKRESWEADIPQHKEEFLARGGIIQMIPFGESRYNPTLTIIDISKKTYEYRQQKNADAEAKGA
jgi:hypothetical protein